MNDTCHEFSQENYLSISKDMFRITDFVLRSVVKKTEDAASAIGNKIQSLSNLSEEQAKSVKEIISGIYGQGSKNYKDISEIAMETNRYADQIFESALSGDLEEADRIGQTEHYQELKKTTNHLSKELERLTESDKELAAMIMPVVMALQFQDSVRQSLENLIRCFVELNQCSVNLPDVKLPESFGTHFWSRIENQFNTTEERNMVRQIIYGDHATLIKDANLEDPFLI